MSARWHAAPAVVSFGPALCPQPQFLAVPSGTPTLPSSLHPCTGAGRPEHRGRAGGARRRRPGARLCGAAPPAVRPDPPGRPRPAAAGEWTGGSVLWPGAVSDCGRSCCPGAAVARERKLRLVCCRSLHCRSWAHHPLGLPPLLPLLLSPLPLAPPAIAAAYAAAHPVPATTPSLRLAARCLLALPASPLPQDEPLTWLATRFLELRHPLAEAMKAQVGGRVGGLTCVTCGTRVCWPGSPCSAQCMDPTPCRHLLDCRARWPCRAARRCSSPRWATPTSWALCGCACLARVGMCGGRLRPLPSPCWLASHDKLRRLLSSPPLNRAAGRAVAGRVAWRAARAPPAG